MRHALIPAAVAPLARMYTLVAAYRHRAREADVRPGAARERAARERASAVAVASRARREIGSGALLRRHRRFPRSLARHLSERARLGAGALVCGCHRLYHRMLHLAWSNLLLSLPREPMALHRTRAARNGMPSHANLSRHALLAPTRRSRLERIFIAITRMIYIAHVAKMPSVMSIRTNAYTTAFPYAYRYTNTK